MNSGDLRTEALVLAASASVALARQVALVVGNSTYAHIGRLPNPENDAVDLSAALRRRLGFEVTTELGHGLEMDGINCLVPVDARLGARQSTCATRR